MEEEKYQKELFEFKKPKRLFPKLAGIFPKADFEGRALLTLTLERAIFILIGVIMLMVLVYALGVERGRSLGDKREKSENLMLKQDSGAVLQPQKAEQAKMPQFLLTAPVAQNKPFTVVAATFTKEANAQDEALRLKGKGFDTFVMQSNSYFQVCVGSYDSAQSAKEAAIKVRRIYKDAYIKTR